MAGLEVALLVFLSIAVIALIVTLMIVLKRLERLADESTLFLKEMREEMSETLKEIRGASENISALAGVSTAVVAHVDKILVALEKFEPAEMVTSLAGKAIKYAGQEIGGLLSGLKTVMGLFHRPSKESPKQESKVPEVVSSKNS